MTEAERLEKLERRAMSHDRSITALTVAIENIKDTFERMESTQEKVSNTLAKISESLADQKHIQKDVDELKADRKHRDEHGSPFEKSLDKRVGEIEGVARFVNFKIYGAIIMALIALILKY